MLIFNFTGYENVGKRTDHCENATNALKDTTLTRNQRITSEPSSDG